MFDDGRVLAVVEKLRDEAMADAMASLSDAEASAAIVDLHEAIQALTAVQLRLVRQLDQSDFAQRTEHQSTAGWLRDHLRVDWHVARGMVGQAALLGRRPALEEALYDGQVTAAQVNVIGEALRFLPDKVPPEVVTEAEEALVGHAQHFEPARLRRIGDRILEHVAPEIAERLEGESLRRAEQRAWWRRGLTLGGPVSGSVRVTGCLTVEDAAIVRAALDPLCAPSRQYRDGQQGDGQQGDGQQGDGQQPDADRSDDTRSPRQRRADALVEVCRVALRGGKLPDHGGQAPQLTVTVPYETLTRGLGFAVTEDGGRLPAETARRLACEARILPVVLGGTGQPLDLGRSRRLFSTAQRQALAVRDGGCAFPGCDRPPRWCDAHHMTAWHDGGTTDVAHGVLVCRPHHRLLHEGGWTARCGSDGIPEFVPPAYVDPSREPQRNFLHPPSFHRRT